MKKIKSVISVVLLLMASIVNAQQLDSYSLFYNDLYLVNPAYAGVKQNLELTTAIKQKWSGFAGAPSFQTLSGHMRFMDNMGAGGRIFNYSAGMENKLGLEGTYAYRLQLGGSMYLSMALSAVLYQYSINKFLINAKDDYDLTVMKATDKMIVPDFNFGMFFYDEDKHYYTGLSVYQLMGRKVSLLNQDNLENRQIRHYNFTGGYFMDINDNVSIESGLLLKFIETGYLQLDFNVNATFMKMFNVGVSYRTDNAVVAMFGLKTGSFMFGYAYDYTLSDIGKYSVGSHEIFLTYQFGSNSDGATKF